MNKLAIREAFPPGIVGREIVLAQMCHHYRRITSAKARVDTNLFKPPKISLSRPLSAEVASIVQRSLSPRSPPKHRRCLKYEHELGEHHIKPSVRSQTAESRLRSTPEVYHPAVKSTKPHHQEFDGQQQGTQTSLENSLTEDEDEPKTRDEAVQTVHPGLYRPLDGRSVQFLRDITNDALHRRAFTSSALNRIFLDHQFRNTYGLSQELMERELEELRRQLGMLPRHRTTGSMVSDGEALDALDSLVLDPRIKEQVIHSLRLSRANDVKKPTYSYFDRLNFDEEDEPIRDGTSAKLRETLRAVESFEAACVGPTDVILADSKPHETAETKDGWNAEIEEDDREATTASSSKEMDEEDESDVEAELVTSGTESDEKKSSASEDSSDLEEEIEEVTQRESTSKHTTDNPSKLGETTQQDSNIIEKHSEQVSAGSAENNLSGESLPLVTPLKLEPTTTKGDRWRSSLEVVKEESDSTTGQVSDISSASTPTEDEINSKVPNSTATTESVDSSPTAQKRDTMEASKQLDTSSSTGGEIVRHMDDLTADTDGKLTGPLSDEISRKEGIEPKGTEEEDEPKSEDGSEVESVHSEEEADENSESQSDTESDMDSIHTD